MSRQQGPVRVQLESGKRRVFASALDWPGWSRSGRDEAGALSELEAAYSRYAPVALEAGLALPTREALSFQVVERTQGGASTDFGVPGEVATGDGAPIEEEEATRLAVLTMAAWTVFDRVVDSAPAALRKGPRGGGRDRDAIVEHVLGAACAYAPKLGMRLKQPPAGETEALAEFKRSWREAISSAPGWEPGPKQWPARYAARRMAWHLLDHAWEIEDRSRPLESLS